MVWLRIQIYARNPLIKTAFVLQTCGNAGLYMFWKFWNCNRDFIIYVKDWCWTEMHSSSFTVYIHKLGQKKHHIFQKTHNYYDIWKFFLKQRLICSSCVQRGEWLFQSNRYKPLGSETMWQRCICSRIKIKLFNEKSHTKLEWIFSHQYRKHIYTHAYIGWCGPRSITLYARARAGAGIKMIEAYSVSRTGPVHMYLCKEAHLLRYIFT